MWKAQQILENARREDKTKENYRFYVLLLKQSDVADDYEKYEEAKAQLKEILEEEYDR